MSPSLSPSFLPTVLQISSRLICIGSLIWFGLIIAQASSSLPGADGAAAKVPPANRAVQTIAPAAPLLPTEGYWTFAGAQLSVSQSTCSAFELQSKLAQLAKLRVVESESIELSYDARDLIELAESNGATCQPCGGGKLWSFTSEAMELRLVTSNAAQPKLVGAAFAIDAGGTSGQWQLTTFEPARPAHGHLLPIPSDASTKCARLDNSGRVQMELVTTSETNQELFERWKSAGWTVRHTPWGSPESFSFLCVRDNVTVYVWSASATYNLGQQTRTLMLTSADINK